MRFENENINFEEALQKIEQIIDNLENNQISLEENLKEYKKGMKLCLLCEKELKKAKLQIKEYEEENLEE